MTSQPCANILAANEVQGVMAYPVPENEAERNEALRSYRIMDTPPEIAHAGLRANERFYAVADRSRAGRAQS